MSLGGYGGEVRQFVTADSGVAYGVIGADLHVFGEGLPLYLLFEFDRASTFRAGVLPGEAPSRLLDARRQIVEFTGRREELADLARWRDEFGARLSARWLHAPGGQGKTRLAIRFAAECAAAGWKVVAAQHGSGTAVDEFGSQDLRLDGAAGLLLVVDYADRWPQPHLAWLLSNALLHRPTPTRILLLARSASTWPAVRAELARIGAATDTRRLSPVPVRAEGAERERIFAVARDCFARHYQIADPAGIKPPGSLDGDAFGLTLALHMAALAAVDAHARGADAPADPVRLRTYLLDREKGHWEKLHASGLAGLDYRTRPKTMARVVFTATLAGPTTFRQGTALISRLGLGVATDQLLDDHAVCYPPATPGNTTEPLYPDSLGEDFIALNLPGHEIADYSPEIWAQDTAQYVAGFEPAAAGDGGPGAFARRAITVLAAAADRWPHIVPYLEDILRADPRLGVAAGGAVLAELAALDFDPVLLEALDDQLPGFSRTDLDIGAALLAERVAAPRLARVADPVGRMLLYQHLGTRLRHAGRLTEALTLHRRAAGLGELFARTMGAAGAPFGTALTSHGATLADLGRYQRAVAVTQYAAEVFSGLATAGLEDEEVHAGFGAAMHNLASQYGRAGQPESAVTVGEGALVLRRQLAAADRPKYEPGLAETLGNLSWQLGGMSRWAQAHAASEESIAICRRLAEAEPARYEPVYAAALHNLGLTSLQLGRPAQAVAATEDAIAIRRRLAVLNPVIHRPLLAGSLTNLAICQSVSGHGAEALAAAEESAAALQEPASANPAAYALSLAVAHDLARRLRGGEPPSAAEAVVEDPASASDGRSALIDAAVERGIPVVELTPVDSVWFGPALAARRAQQHLAEGRPTEAAKIYTSEVATARKARDAFATGGFDVTPRMQRAFELRLAESLRALGCVQADLEDYPQALSMTAEALEILRRSSPEEPDEIQWLIRGLESFALVRAHAREDLVNALDAVADESAILQELIGEPVSGHADHITRARATGRAILFLLGPGDEAVAARLRRNPDYVRFLARERELGNS